MSAQPELTRAQVLNNIFLLTEWNAEIRGHLENQSPLIPDLCDIVMNYFEGMWSDDIMCIWSRLYASTDGDDELSDAIIDFVRLMRAPAERRDISDAWKSRIDSTGNLRGDDYYWEYCDAMMKYPCDDAGPEIFREIIEALGLDVSSPMMTLDDEIVNYIISIYNTCEYIDPNLTFPSYAISFEEMNAIYILMCALIQQSHGMIRRDMPVWDPTSMRFVANMRLPAKLPTKLNESIICQ